MTTKPSLTVIVLTRNEAPRLARCLQSFQTVADEMLVVDSGSEDETVAIAREFTPNVIRRDWPGRARQSQFAAEQVSTDWFFHVDADEVSTPELNADMVEVIAQNLPGVAGYSVDRYEQFLGREVRCGLHRGILRLCRTGTAVMPLQRAHAAWTVSGEVLRLHSPLWHLVDQSLDELLAKLTQRGLLSALDYYDRGIQAPYRKVLWHPLATFLRMMILKGGMFDGIPGLILSGMRSQYCFTRMARLHELWREHEARQG
jgi:glycosyltransferase involved in cell wall biosynthesis